MIKGEDVLLVHEHYQKVIAKYQALLNQAAVVMRTLCGDVERANEFIQLICRLEVLSKEQVKPNGPK